METDTELMTPEMVANLAFLSWVIEQAVARDCHVVWHGTKVGRQQPIFWDLPGDLFYGEPVDATVPPVRSDYN